MTFVFTCCMIFSIVLAFFFFRRLEDWQPVDRWSAALIFPMAVTITAMLILKVEWSLFDDRNWERLQAAFALARGFPVYHAPESGPVLISICGPVSMFIFFPATLATTPTAAMHIAALILIACFFLPPLLLHLIRTADEETGRRIFIYRLFIFLIFCFFPLISKPLRDAAFSIHVDGPTLGVAGLACAFLYFWSGQRRALYFHLSAVFAVLAVWSKQVAVPLLIALPVYLLMTEGLKMGLRYALYLFLYGILISGIFLFIFGPHNLLFNILAIPSRHGLRGSHSLLVSFANLLGEIAVVLILLLISVVPFFLRNRNTSEGVRNWRGLMFLVVGLLMIPTAILGNAKIGGSTNTLSYPAYFLLLAGTLGLVHHYSHRSIRTFFNAIAILFLCIEIPRVYFYNARLSSETNYAETAFAYIKKHPDEAYFPRLVVLNLIAENKIYHSSSALKDRDWAGMRVSREHLLAYVPKNMKILAFRKASDNDREWLDLPEFPANTEDPELPGFWVYKKQ